MKAASKSKKNNRETVMRRVAVMCAFALCLGSAPAMAALMEFTYSGDVYHADPNDPNYDQLPDELKSPVATFEFVQLFDTQSVLSSTVNFVPSAADPTQVCLEGYLLQFAPAQSHLQLNFTNGASTYYSALSSFTVFNFTAGSPNCSGIGGFGSVSSSLLSASLDIFTKSMPEDEFLSSPDPFATVLDGGGFVFGGSTTVAGYPIAPNLYTGGFRRVPEPATLGLLSTALLGLSFIARVGSRRRSVAKSPT